MLVPTPSALVRMVFTAPTRLYRQFLSLAFGLRRCYSPSYSAYILQVTEIHGTVKGIVLGCWQPLRCNLWSLGGIDHVSEKGRWTPDPWIPPEDWVDNAAIERPLPMDMNPNMENKDSTNLEDEGREVLIHPGSVHRPIDEAHSPDLVLRNHPTKTGQSKDAPGVRAS